MCGIPAVGVGRRATQVFVSGLVFAWRGSTVCSARSWLRGRSPRARGRCLGNCVGPVLLRPPGRASPEGRDVAHCTGYRTVCCIPAPRSAHMYVGTVSPQHRVGQSWPNIGLTTIPDRTHIAPEFGPALTMDHASIGRPPDPVQTRNAQRLARDFPSSALGPASATFNAISANLGCVGIDYGYARPDSAGFDHTISTKFCPIATKLARC